MSLYTFFETRLPFSQPARHMTLIPITFKWGKFASGAVTDVLANGHLFRWQPSLPSLVGQGSWLRPYVHGLLFMGSNHFPVRSRPQFPLFAIFMTPELHGNVFSVISF